MKIMQLKGSFTIEASLIIPIAFLVMVIAIYTGMLLCQECIQRESFGYAENWDAVSLFYVLQSVGEGETK